VALRVAGRPCLVVGAGPVAARKVADLLAAGALVSVVAPEAVEAVRALAAAGSVSWEPRGFDERDLDGVRLVVTATGHREVDERVYRAADERGLWVNSADDPDRCSFYLTAQVRRDPVIVAVTTAGSSPALASYLRRHLELVLGRELGPLASVLASIRDELHASGRRTEGLAWADAVDDELVALARSGRWDEARARTRARLGMVR
jgi:siroheme synthase-like protein